jgi:uncharacterized membrane protein
MLLTIGKYTGYQRYSRPMKAHGAGRAMADITGHSVKYLRPLHPPFTHFPIAAYVFAAGFDIVSAVGGSRSSWAGQLWHAGTFVLVAGLAICLVTMVTGFADLVRFGERRSAVLATLAVHVCIQAAVFMIGVADVAIRVADYHRASASPVALLLSVVAAAGVCSGAFFGGLLVYRHGHGVAIVPDPAAATLAAIAGEAGPPMPNVTRPGRVRPGTRHRAGG